MSLKDDLKALKDLSRAQRTEEDLNGLPGLLNNQSDLTVVLLCSTLLEEATEELLQAYMVDLNSTTTAELFRGVGPLASLSARTKMLHALGLIGPTTKHNLDLAREVRNALAHSRRPLSFSHERVAKVIDRFRFQGQVTPHDVLEEVKSARQRHIVMSMLIWTFMTGAARTNKFNPPRLLP